MTTVKILYVEDEPSLGRIVKESLESRSFEVCMVMHGDLALAEFQKFSPDICILDIMLPGRDGYTVAREIRSLSPLIPIIFLTAKSQTEDLLKGFEAGGNDYLRKPFSMEELIVRINNLLKLSQSGTPAARQTIKVGNYEFIPHRYELRRGDTVKKLSHREATLLSMLIEKKTTRFYGKIF